MQDWQAVWSRLHGGEHVVVRQSGRFPQPNPSELRLVAVQCEDFVGPRAVLDEAQRGLDRAFGASPHPLVDAAALRLRAGLRRHLLGEAPERADVARYFEALDRAVAAGEPRIALLLRDVDRADPSSLELLVQLLGGARLPRLPLLLSFQSAQPTGAASRLLEQLRRVLPRAAFFWEPEPVEPALGSAPALPRGWPSLRPQVRGLLRAAATIGDRFESEILSQLFELDELAVLGALQEALDHGVAIEDGGQGTFRFEPTLGNSLRINTLPSLARAWHERLAELFGGPPAPSHAAPVTSVSVEAATAPESEPPAASEAQRVERAAVPSDAAATPAESTPAAAPADTTAQAPTPGEANPWSGAAPREQPLDPRREDWWRRLEADLLAARARTAPLPETARAVSEPRAASHAEAAGLWQTACEQHLAAAERASLSGADRGALEHASQALAAAERIDDRTRSRRMRALALLLIGRCRWQSRGPSGEFPLAAALEPLLQCRALLDQSAPAQLRAELGVLIANVQYDLGSPEALEQALNELTLASQLLLDAGQPLEAARLLNDEAAVWVKLGDPVRANYLLGRSREVFSRVVGSHPDARSELAETEHLLARLLFHAVARPGRERDALQLGVQHALAAEEGYRGLQQPRQLGRVWETLGRLELRLGHLDRALQRLENARQLQQELGDGIGLARSTAALADVLAERRDYPGALTWLAESIKLNSAKGLLSGIEFNLASLRRLESQLPLALHDRARELEQRLRSALQSDAGTAVMA